MTSITISPEVLLNAVIFLIGLLCGKLFKKPRKPDGIFHVNFSSAEGEELKLELLHDLDEVISQKDLYFMVQVAEDESREKH